MSIRATSIRPNISSPTFNSSNNSRISKTLSPRPQQSSHRTTSNRSHHQSPRPSASRASSSSQPFETKLQSDPEGAQMGDQDVIAPLPASPTPQKAGASNKRTKARRKHLPKGERGSDQRVGGADHMISTDDEGALFDILGVSSPQVGASTDDGDDQPRPSTRGVLHITKAEIDGKSARSKRTNKKTVMDSDHEHSSSTPLPKSKTASMMRSEGETISEEEGRKYNRARNKRNVQDEMVVKHQKDPALSTLSASRPRPVKSQNNPSGNVVKEPAQADHLAFETASLSQSLPTEGLLSATRQRADKARKKGKKDAASGKDDNHVWEMPEQSGSTASQGLTWQQKLQSSTGSAPSESPRRSAKTAQSGGTPSTSERKSRSRAGLSAVDRTSSAALNSPAHANGGRPAHSRRVSADNLPISAFDDTLPFHTGMNVHRAPQTPAKLHTSKAPAYNLPLIPGEFPRIGRQPHGPSTGSPSIGVGGAGTPLSTKYAGPTFHNSPHAASLPKPDLDDF